MPSSSTSVRPAPLGPKFRSVTPCVVGLAVRLLFRKRTSVFAATGLGLVTLAAGAVVFLQTSAIQSSAVAAWCEMKGSAGQAAGVKGRVEFGTLSSRTGGKIDVTGPALVLVVPTWRQYWQLPNLTVELTSDSMRVSGGLARGGTVLLERQEFSVAGLIPAYPETAADRTRVLDAFHVYEGWFVQNGYVFAADDFAKGQIFASWLREHHDVRQSLEAWYAMRFRGDAKYLLWIDSGVPHVVEFQ